LVAGLIHGDDLESVQSADRDIQNGTAAADDRVIQDAVEVNVVLDERLRGLVVRTWPRV
jgi:hypothetical protein